MFSFRYLHRNPSTFFLVIRSYAPRRIDSQNPGLGKQLKVLKDVQELTDDPEGFGDLETDFMNVHKSHKQYEKETVRHKENIRLWITKNKYFKDKQPNFLMYAEKEQIKLLHNRDPEEWSPEVLAENFPADTNTIHKILKAKWIAKSKERIQRHDQTVLRNWDLYREGKLEINDDLKEHLDKYLNRKIGEDLKNVKLDDLIPSKLKTEPKVNEFSKIITSCKQYTDKTKLMLNDSSEKFEKQNDESKEQKEFYENLKNQNQKCPGEDETYLMDHIHDRRYMRLEDVKKVKMNSISTTENRNELQQLEKEENNQENNANQEQEQRDGDGRNKLQLQIEQNPFKNLKKFETQEVEICQEDMIKYDVSSIKQRIYIPKKLWKKDATYKVKDCYYDYDGEFLYRVPGMTGNKV